MSPYYQDHLITLYHGDSLQVANVGLWARENVLITDPPYGIDYRTNTGGQFTGIPVEGDRTTEARDLMLELWGTKPAIVFASPRQDKPPGNPNPTPLIFDKGDIVGMGDLNWPWKPNYELAWVYGKGWVGHRDSSILRHRVLPGNFTGRDHPTEKPVSLLEALIAKAPPGVIADPFAGGGSTLLAARNLNRQAVGFEIDERYCEIIAKRAAQHTLDFTEAPNG